MNSQYRASEGMLIRPARPQNEFKTLITAQDWYDVNKEIVASCESYYVYNYSIWI